VGTVSGRSAPKRGLIDMWTVHHVSPGAPESSRNHLNNEYGKLLHVL
jgi:hypothetical protein